VCWYPGSPCALALVPLAYACAIAAITARGILVKSGSAIDALAACKTIALDKTGTITTGSLNLAEGFVITAAAPSSSRDGLPQHEPAPGSSSSSSSAAAGQPVHVRAMQGLAELCQRVVGSSSSSGGASLGTTTGFGAGAFDSDDYALDDVNPGSAGAAAAAVAGGGSGSSSAGTSGSDGTPGFDVYALKCAVALSRLSNHPVSRAMVDSAPNMDGDVSVLSFEQVGKEGMMLYNTNGVYCWDERFEHKCTRGIQRIRALSVGMQRAAVGSSVLYDLHCTSGELLLTGQW